MSPRLLSFIRLILFLSALAWQGCTAVSQEDHDFFYSGWVHPHKDPADHKFYHDFWTNP